MPRIERLGPGMNAPDLQAVGELCRLAVVARRLGCKVHLNGADADLRALLDLAGVDDILPECPAKPNGPACDPDEGDLR